MCVTNVITKLKLFGCDKISFSHRKTEKSSVKALDSQLSARFFYVFTRPENRNTFNPIPRPSLVQSCIQIFLYGL